MLRKQTVRCYLWFYLNSPHDQGYSLRITCYPQAKGTTVDMWMLKLSDETMALLVSCRLGRFSLGEERYAHCHCYSY